MTSWQETLAPIVRNVEKHYDALRYRLYYALGGPDPIQIVPYRGYGTCHRLYLMGRVLEKRGITSPTDADTVWDNLLNMYRRFDSDEIPYAKLVARFQDIEQSVQADEEGMFNVYFELEQALPADQMWQEVELELVEPHSDEQEGTVRAVGRVLIPPSEARLLVISDIDDTVLQTNATNLLRMARTVFLGNARTRLPFPGVAAFYRALHAGLTGKDRNPLFYVSNSPWNLYDLLSEFFHLQNIPVGPVIFLRNWGVTHRAILPTQQQEHKLGLIRQMLEVYTDWPVILIGDSGEADPEIYYEIVRQYPGRVRAVYIRNVERDLERAAAIEALAEEIVKAGSSLIMAENTLVMAEHAAEQGWIARDALDEIRAEKERDEGPPSRLERLLGEEEKVEGPRVVVEDESVSAAEHALEEGAIEAALEVGESVSEGTPSVIVDVEEEKADQG